MAVSGSKDHSITRADIIEASLRKLGVYDSQATITGDETKSAAAALNLMVKSFVIQGADIWLRDEITLFLVKDKQSYALGTADATREVKAETTLSASEASGQTIISVTSSTGMTASDFFGVKLDDNTIHWTTISSISSNNVTIATGLPSAATKGKKVYAYTTKAGRPTKIVSAYRRDKNDIDSEITIIGESDYRLQSNKGSAGPPVEIWYQPTLTTGTLYVWPVDGGANWDKLVMSAQYYPDDFDTAADNPQFPIEWGEALVYGLADRLAPEYGIDRHDRMSIKYEADRKLDDALNYDVENASVVFALEVQR